MFPELKGVLRRLWLTIHNSPTIAGASATTTATSTRFADSSILASTSTNEPRAAEPVHSTRRYTVNMCPLSKFLLEAGANADGIGYGDGTPLMAAVNYQLTGAVTLLLQHGADPNLPSPLTGETPLHIAALRGFGNGSTECAELLLDAGANPNVTTNVDVVTPSMASGTTVIGETPLH